MKVNKLHDITLDTDEAIVTATLSKANDVVMLMSSGSVLRFDLSSRKAEDLFTVKSQISYADGGFDLNAQTSIYTMDEIVVLANDFKRHCFVHYPAKYNGLHLWRGDYHADISTYPILLFKNADGVPHLIYGESWNHIQIMNLDTRQVLTAAKSLIQEGAEERHIVFYKKHTEDNKFLWPRPYDYFFGKLFVSPDQTKFLSAGWTWGSLDCYNVYHIETFINSNRISDICVGSWEHENRPTCWVDNETVAVLYNPLTEGDDGSTTDSSFEIHFHKIGKDQVEIENKIRIADKNILSSKLYFNRTMNSFILVFDKGGLLVISLSGQTIVKDEAIKVNEYSVETGRFLLADNRTILIYELTE